MLVYIILIKGEKQLWEFISEVYINDVPRKNIEKCFINAMVIQNHTVSLTF